MGSGCVFGRDVDHPSSALQPEAPDRTVDEPFESTDGLAFGLALRDSSIEILPCLFGMVSLGQSDPIDDRIESPVATTVETMTDKAGGRCFQWREFDS
jgi:hypothetical protein